eukprot:3940681-Rhodomonas_salina.3
MPLRHIRSTAAAAMLLRPPYSVSGTNFRYAPTSNVSWQSKVPSDLPEMVARVTSVLEPMT